MGYESKVFVTRKLGDYNDVLAVFDLRKVGYQVIDGRSFCNVNDGLFDIPLNQPLSSIGYDEDGVIGYIDISMDMYDNGIKGQKLDVVINWIEKYLKECDYYLMRTFYQYLLALKPLDDEENPILIYQFGY